MHGLKNDFVLIRQREEQGDWNELAKRVCDRRTGVGADGLVLLQPTNSADKIAWRIFNADGSEAEFCGNAARCVAKYQWKHTHLSHFTLSTPFKSVDCSIMRNDSVFIDMGEPVLRAAEIPAIGFQSAEVIGEHKQFPSLPAPLIISLVNFGNPHCVVHSPIDSSQFVQMGPIIERADCFPQGVNVEFVTVTDKHKCQVRVWERGCGETLACGTGAAAVVVAGVLLQQLVSPVQVQLVGGSLQFAFSGRGDRVLMEGPAEFCFEGHFSIQ